MNKCSDADNQSIPVVVVESHQHVLEHIHAVLRRRARLHTRKMRHKKKRIQDNDNCTSPPVCAPPLLPPLSMIHLDSHPDLACPSPCVPAGACFEPRKEWHTCTGTTTTTTQYSQDNGEKSPTEQDTSRNLYEYLDLDRSGIAQWILPLVLSGDLNFMHWIRSSWADQMMDGTYEYRVGAWLPPPSMEGGQEHQVETRIEAEFLQSFVDLPQSATVKVDLRHPYYFEDNSVVPTEELWLMKEMKLLVSELPKVEDVKESPLKEEESEEKDWILDICLDYFICDNAFLKDIEEIDRRFAAALLAAVKHTSFSSSQYQEEYRRFHELMTSLLLSAFATSPRSPDYEDYADTKGNISLLDQYQDLYDLYVSQSVGEAIIEELLQAVNNITSTDASKLLHLAIDALPSMSLPRDDYLDDDTALRRADLQIETLSAHLQAGTLGFKQRPVVITIARSSDDGYTPKETVKDLQRKVLEMVHSVYCNCSARMDESKLYGRADCDAGDGYSECMLKLMFDYGEREGSQLL